MCELLRLACGRAGREQRPVLFCVHPTSPLHRGRQSFSPQAPSGHLKIYNLTHPDPLLWFLPGASLRNPFTAPKKLRLCQGLPQTELNSGILMFESFSIKYESGSDQSKLALENGREVEALGPGDQDFCLKSSFASSEKTWPPFSEPQFPNPENGDSRTFCLSNSIMPGIKTSNGNKPGVAQQEIGKTNCGVSTQ